MKINDTYLTVDAVTEGLYRDRGSRFISRAMPVTNACEAKSEIEKHRKIYHDARHLCHAFVTGYEGENWRCCDDGEPSGTAGNPILAQIRSRSLTNILVIVVRYFGGKLLGTAGLVNAYRTAAGEALDKARLIKRIRYNFYSVSFPYSRTGKVMKVLNDANAVVVNQEFSEDCRLIAGIRLSLCRLATEKLTESSDIQIIAVAGPEAGSFK